MRQQMMGFWDGSGISWTIREQSAPHSRQITSPTPHHSTFTGRMLFLTPNQQCQSTHTHRHTHTRLTALFPGLPRSAGTRQVKPSWILLKQEIVSGSGINWAICMCAPCSRQITTPTPHHSVFYRPDALPAAQPTVSKHWRQNKCHIYALIIND